MPILIFECEHEDAVDAHREYNALMLLGKKKAVPMKPILS